MPSRGLPLAPKLQVKPPREMSRWLLKGRRGERVSPNSSLCTWQGLAGGHLASSVSDECKGMLREGRLPSAGEEAAQRRLKPSRGRASTAATPQAAARTPALPGETPSKIWGSQPALRRASPGFTLLV